VAVGNISEGQGSARYPLALIVVERWPGSDGIVALIRLRLSGGNAPVVNQRWKDEHQLACLADCTGSSPR
jgi:hypothetical protein